MDALTAFVIDFRYTIEIMTVVIAIIIAVSSIDDLFLDLYYWFLKITGNGHVRDRERVADLDLLESIPEKPFAIMVPAWREHAVIFSMLEANSRLLRYSNHHYFVGVYQNDQATQIEVKRALCSGATRNRWGDSLAHAYATAPNAGIVSPPGKSG